MIACPLEILYAPSVSNIQETKTMVLFFIVAALYVLKYFTLKIQCREYKRNRPKFDQSMHRSRPFASYWMTFASTYLLIFRERSISQNHPGRILHLLYTWHILYECPSQINSSLLLSATKLTCKHSLICCFWAPISVHLWGTTMPGPYN